MEINFNTNGNDKQKEVCKLWVNNYTTDIVYGGSKGSGKSYLLAALIFGDALMYPETHYFIARKKLNDLRKYTIPTINEVLQNFGVGKQYYEFNAQDNYFKLYNGSKVFLLEAKYLPADPEYQRFGSMAMTRGACEESGELDEFAKNNLAASIGRWKNDEYNLTGKLLQTCNPSKNYLYKQYYKKFRDGELEGHKAFIQAFPEDNKMIDSGYLEHLNNTLSKSEKERLLKGNWEYDNNPSALCEYEDILAAFVDELQQETGNRKPKYYITADIARMGSDLAVIMVWKGLSVIDKKVFKTSTIDQLYHAIRGLMTKYGISRKNVVCDADGVGGGVVDMLKCKSFINNSKALKNENYNSLKDQCSYKLATAIRNQELFILNRVFTEKEKEMIIEELEHLKSYKEDEGGKLRVAPKKDIKALIGRSPDFSDCLLFRFFFELAPSGSITII